MVALDGLHDFGAGVAAAEVLQRNCPGRLDEALKEFFKLRVIHLDFFFVVGRREVVVA